MGLAYQDLNRNGDALDVEQQALAIYHELKDVRNIGRVLGDMAYTYDALGRHDDAARARQEAAALQPSPRPSLQPSPQTSP